MILMRTTSTMNGMPVMTSTVTGAHRLSLENEKLLVGHVTNDL